MALGLPSISPRRVWLIAQRDYLGYIKTWGFWISFLLPVIFGALGFFATRAGLDFQSQRYEAVIDRTGGDVDAMIREALARADDIRSTPTSARSLEDDAIVNTILVEPPADDLEGNLPYLKGERLLEPDGGEPHALDGLLIVTGDPDQPSARYYSRNINANGFAVLVRNLLRREAKRDYLAGGSLTPEGYDEAGRDLDVDMFDPTAAPEREDEGAVTRSDRAPYLVAAGASLFLWFSVFSGAYMLLTSMLEEKMGKLLEMLLASTQFAEIMLGKLVGVAMLTLTALAPYILLIGYTGFLAFTHADPDIVESARAAFSAKMVVFFPVFLLLGYVFYGSLFIALGSLSESMQDAQTLTVPIMIILTVCLLVVPFGMNDPEAPIVQVAGWIPLSAPFAAIVGVAADPPWWKLVAQALFMLASTMVVGWLAARVFRAGVLSDAGPKALTQWLSRTVLRRKAAS